MHVMKWIRGLVDHTPLYLLSRRRNRIIASGVGLLVVIVVIGGVAIGTKSKQTPLEQVNQSYSLQLNQLSIGAKQLPPKIWAAKPTAQDLSDYDDLLYQMEGNCNYLNDNYSAMHSWQLPRKTKDAMSQTKQLCNDLLGVMQYSQNLYHASHNYLVQNMSQWPDANQNYEYTARLNAALQAATATKQQLQTINTSATQDPALEELGTSVTNTLQLIDKAQAALDAKDMKAANDLGGQLTKKLNADRQEFMTARTYFWNNTIQVGKLRLAIANLQVVFKPATSKS